MSKSYHITKKDKLNVLHAFLVNDGVCNLNTILHYLKYYNLKKEQVKKAKLVLKELEKDLQKTIQVKIILIKKDIYALIY